MNAEGLQKASPAGHARLAGVVVGLGLAALAASAASAGGSATASRSPARPVTVAVTFTGKGGGRYLDVTRWLRDDTRECYARRTADETLSISWRLGWTAKVVRTETGYVLRGGPATTAATVSGRVTGTSVRDSCDAAQEEDPGWSGTDTCNSGLPVETAGKLVADRARSGARLFLRGPVFGSPSHPCELEIRNDQLAAHVSLDDSSLSRLAAGKAVSMPVGTAHPRSGDTFAATRNCSAFPHIYEGVVYLYDCNDTLTWRGVLSIVPS